MMHLWLSVTDMAAYSCLERDTRLDSRLLAEAADRWENNDKFHRMLQFRKQLPSYQMREVSLMTTAQWFESLVMQ